MTLDAMTTGNVREAEGLPFPWGAVEDRHGAWAALREERPVHTIRGPITGNDIHWVVSHAGCRQVLEDPATFRNDAATAGFDPGELADEQAALFRHLLNLDPPDHTRLRRLVSKAFTPRVVAAVEPRIRALVTGILDDAEEQGGLDGIADLGLPVPLTVIAELLGVPEEDRDRFHAWSRVIVASDSLDDEELQQRTAAEALGWLVALIEAKRAEPSDDLLSALIAVEAEGDTLSVEELLSMVFLLLIAGHETTVNLIGNGLLSLTRCPEQHDRLRTDPGLLRTAIEEVLRFESPVESTFPRFSAEAAVVDGVAIPSGAIVVPVVLAANRDPSVFADPDVFDVGRSPNPHLAFGHGVHFCVGAALARLEGRIVLEEVLARGWTLRPGDGLDLATPPWTVTPRVLMHGLDRLPLEIVPRTT